MADEQTGQEPKDPTGQEPGGTPQGGATGGQEQPERYDADYVKALRRSEADARTKLKAAEARLKADEDAKLTEQQRLEQRAKDAEEKLANIQRAHQERAIGYEVRLAAAKLGIEKPEAVVKLLNLAAVEYDADGQPTNIEKLLIELQKATAPKQPPAAGNAAGPKPTGKSEQESKEREAELRRRFKM